MPGLPAMRGNLIGNTAFSIKIGAAEKVMATRAAQLALFIVEFVTAARTPEPVFASDFAQSGVSNRRGIR
jgi:hypothetical protein